jgi:16S rRNA processing protein RimM
MEVDALDPMVVMGRIVGAQGILGWVKVQTFTEYLDGLLDYDEWYLGNDKQPWRKVSVLEANVHGKVLVARLPGIPDRTTAEQCKGLVGCSASRQPAQARAGMNITGLI